MAGPTFSSSDPDATYADDPSRPDVEAHQADHSIIHPMLEAFDETDLTGIGPADQTDVLTVDTDGKVRHLPPPTSVPGTPGADGQDGVGFNPMGDWNNSTTYNSDPLLIDVVRHNGATYAALATNTNSEPPSANWQLIAEDGTDGADGATGATGTAGTQGPAGEQGPAGPSEESVQVADTGSDFTADGDTYSVFFLNHDDDTTITPSLTSAPGYLTFFITQDSTGGWDITWGETIAWPADTEPVWSTDPGATDIVTLVKQPNGSWLGTAVLDLLPVAPTVGDLAPEMIASLAGVPATADGVTFQLAPIGGSNGQPIATVEAGDLVLMWIENSRSGATPDLPNVAGLGTWEILDATDGTSVYFTGATQMRLSVFGFMATTAPTAAPVAITFANSHVGCGAIMVRIPGVLVASALSVAKAKVNKDPGPYTDADSSMTLAAALDASNRSIYGAVVNTLQSFVLESLHSKIGEVQHATPTHTLVVGWRSDAFDTSLSVTWGGANQVHAMIGTELQQG